MHATGWREMDGGASGYRGGALWTPSRFALGAMTVDDSRERTRTLMSGWGKTSRSFDLPDPCCLVECGHQRLESLYMIQQGPGQEDPRANDYALKIGLSRLTRLPCAYPSPPHIFQDPLFHCFTASASSARQLFACNPLRNSSAGL